MEYSKDQQHALDMIDHFQERLCLAENNLHYIKALTAIKRWLEKFSEILSDEERLASAEYEAFFFTGCGFSFYDRVNMSIQSYQSGERPF